MDGASDRGQRLAAPQPLSIDPADEDADAIAEPLAPHEMPLLGPENAQTASIAQRELSRLGFYDGARIGTCPELSNASAEWARISL